MDMVSSKHIDVRPLDGALGAEIHGVDLAKPVSEELFSEIYEAWLKYRVIFFREQKITPGLQVAFAKHFGELNLYGYVEPLPGHLEVIPIIKEADTRDNFGGFWHTDTSYLPEPPKATMLYALDVPEKGGDTLFADMVLAYEALSPQMKNRIADVRGVFTASKVHGPTGEYGKADHAMENKNEDKVITERVENPIVRTHPETKEKCLYLDLPHTEKLADMTMEESEPLMNSICQHASREEFTCRFIWRPGSMAIWDNRCVQHNALNDYHGHRREMNRITIRGDKPY